jgi:ribokinase
MPKQPPRLVCLGNFTVDDVYLPDGSITPECMGGDALYAALGARLWEPQVQLMAPLGHDIPYRTLEAMRATGFDLENLPLRDVPTIRTRIFYDAQGGRRWEILASEQEFHILSPRPEDIPEHYLRAQAFLILAMTLAAQENLIEWLRKHTPATLALDTQEDYVVGNEKRVLDLVPQVDIFMPSAVEVVQLLGHRDWLRAAQEFTNMGAKIVVIKCGEEGVFVLNRETGEWFEQVPVSTKIADTTGAGDAFCGGFMAAYIQDPADLRKAALAGSISASFAIASFGMDALLKAKPDDPYLLERSGAKYGD